MSTITIALSRKTLYILSAIAIVSISGFLVLSVENEITGMFLGVDLEGNEIASCPTFWHMLEGLEDEDLEKYYTESTGQNVQGVLSGDIDAFISGRALHPEEPDLNRKILGPGFSFISDESREVFVGSLDEYEFYTDESKEEVIDSFEGITDDNLHRVEDVYGYLENGLVITSLENTDYSRGEIVHVLYENGSRHRYSRTPALYYTDELGENKAEYIAELLRE